jgi:hypothetical protein
MYRCEQEMVCQTLENKTTSTERHRSRLEKNDCDRGLSLRLTPYALRHALIVLKRTGGYITL